MNMRAIVVILAVVALGACTPMAWVKEDAAPERVSEDLGRCQQDAWFEARANTWYYRPMSPAFVRDPRGGRFFVSPGAPYYEPFNDPFMEEVRLTQFCMRNKGYELKPADEAKPGSG